LGCIEQVPRGWYSVPDEVLIQLVNAPSVTVRPGVVSSIITRRGGGPRGLKEDHQNLHLARKAERKEGRKEGLRSDIGLVLASFLANSIPYCKISMSLLML
jgi:hypothetical protein